MANISASAAGAISSPTAISAKALDPESPPFPLNHARILYENALVGASVSVGAGSGGSLTLIPNTAQRWRFTAGGTAAIQFTLPANRTIDTFCIGAHNLGSAGVSYQIFYDLNTSSGGFIAACPVETAISDDPIMCRLPSELSIGRVQINITGGSGSAFIGSIYAGVALQMMRPFYSGHSPANLSRKTEFYSSNTESGNFIGVEIRRMALETNADWKYLTDAWYRQYFVPFLKSAETQPFYFAWNLRDHPDDVAYCKNIVNISPSYMGQLTYMSVGIPIVGIA